MFKFLALHALVASTTQCQGLHWYVYSIFNLWLNSIVIISYICGYLYIVITYWNMSIYSFLLILNLYGFGSLLTTSFFNRYCMNIPRQSSPRLGMRLVTHWPSDLLISILCLSLSLMLVLKTAFCCKSVSYYMLSTHTMATFLSVVRVIPSATLFPSHIRARRVWTETVENAKKWKI